MIEHDLEELLAEKRRRNQNLQEASNVVDTGKQQRMQQERDSAREDINRKLGITGKAVAAAPAAGADFLGSLYNLSNYGIQRAAGTPSDKINYDNFYDPIGPQIKQNIDQFTGGQFKPQSRGERMLDSALDFLGGTRVNQLAKATQKSPVAQKYLSPQSNKEWAGIGSAGAGFELGKEAFPDSTIMPIVASLLASRAPNVASAAANPIGSLADLFKVNPEKAATFQKAGVNPRLGDVSDSGIVKGLQNRLENLPLSGYPIQKSANKAAGIIENKFNKGLTPEGAGEVAQSGLSKERANKKEYFGNKEKELQSHLPADKRLNVSNSIESLSQRPELFTEGRNKAFDNSEIGRKYKELQSLSNEGIIPAKEAKYGPLGELIEAGQPQQGHQGIPYNDLRDFRQSLDNEISSWTKYGTKEIGRMKYLRNKVNQDIGEGFKAQGPEAYKAWREYNSEYSKFAKEQEKIVDKLIDNKSATEIFNKVMSNLKVDGRYANKVLNTLSGKEREVFSNSMIKELGSNKQNEFNINNLATNFKTLNPEAQDIALTNFSASGKKEFKEIINAIDLIKETGSKANYSNSANALQQGAAYLSAGSGLYYHPYITALAAAGLGSSGLLMSSPKFINWLAKSRSIKTPEQAVKYKLGLRTIARTSPQMAAAIDKYERAIEEPNVDIGDYDLDALLEEKRQRGQ